MGVPSRDAIIRLVGAVLSARTGQWAEGRRCLGLDVLARDRLTLTTTDPVNEADTDALPALTALIPLAEGPEDPYTTFHSLTVATAADLANRDFNDVALNELQVAGSSAHAAR